MKNKILLGVYLMYCLRKLKSPLVAETLVFAALVIILFYFVSVSSVLRNMLNSGDFYHYFIMAFASSDFLVKLVLVLTGVTALLFVRKITVSTVLKQRFA